MRILVVEDEPRLLRSLAKALREEGYAVDTAEAGDDGWFKASTYDYDAIVLDIMLPGLNGWELLERLRAVIRRALGRASSLIEVRDVIIDTRARSVMRSGRAVALTAREYAILEYLVLHRGEVVTRTMLYEHLFDETDDTLSNLLDVHVFNLRKKLGADLVVTRRGQGYCVER
jgi:two-component system, OmpR family, response regulator